MEGNRLGTRTRRFCRGLRLLVLQALQPLPSNLANKNNSETHHFFLSKAKQTSSIGSGFVWSGATLLPVASVSMSVFSAIIKDVSCVAVRLKLFRVN